MLQKENEALDEYILIMSTKVTRSGKRVKKNIKGNHINNTQLNVHLM